jgi:hypothetical protein
MPKGRWAMKDLDRFLEYLAAVVFVCVGLANIFGMKRRPRSLGARSAVPANRFEKRLLTAVGLVQIAAALILIPPHSFSSAVAPWAAAGLLLVTLAGAMYQLRHRESAVPNLALFLLTVLVVVGRWM